MNELVEVDVTKQFNMVNCLSICERGTSDLLAQGPSPAASDSRSESLQSGSSCELRCSLFLLCTKLIIIIVVLKPLPQLRYLCLVI